MKRSNFWVMGALLLCLPSISTAQNTGQDATQPLTRFDIRYQHDALPFDLYHNNFDNKNDTDTIVLRADAPVSLDENGTLYFRTDFPFISSSSSTPDQNGSFDLGSIYAQAIYIAPEKFAIGGKYIWGAGLSAQLGSATNGRQKTTWIPTFGMAIPIYPFGQERGGSAFIPMFKYLMGDSEALRGGTLTFDEINEFHFLPTLNFTLPWSYFEVFTLWGNEEWQWSFQDGTVRNEQKSGDYFIPYDITIGKMIANNNVIISLSAAGPLLYSEGYKQYDHRLMFRLGFFFGQ
ncbi:hypothetical protein [Ferrimonas gelatinilytica]|uniref:Transporter n=1 Tax=Ferrimonas gelatinilytica TaxID=1255257 RepID=A0ABP9RZM0_9GAMM